MRAKKELGQNFLVDPQVVVDLIRASDPKPDDIYLEIGPGLGVVTKILAPKVKKVVAVELDSDLIPGLKKLSDMINNIKVANEDILSYLAGQTLNVKCQFNKIVGSIPYQITSPLLYSLAELSSTSSLESATLLIQKEVAKKILAKAPDASYLSNFIQAYFDLEFVVNVSRESFQPIPKVDGAIIKLSPKTYHLKPYPDPDDWSAFLHQGFKFPRKMIKKVFDEKMLLLVGVKPAQRAQEITLDQWFSLYQLYEEITPI